MNWGTEATQQKVVDLDKGLFCIQYKDAEDQVSPLPFPLMHTDDYFGGRVADRFRLADQASRSRHTLRRQ
jgi:hypothetical protein